VRREGKDYEMQPSGILYDSLPMMRLGVRNEDEQVVVAPDFSTFAYMLEEYITLATVRIVIPASSPEAKRLADLPLLLQKRVTLIDDAPEREAVSRLLYPVRAELGVQETDDGKQLRCPKGMPPEAKYRITVVHRFLFRLAAGFNHGVQVSISPEDTQNVLRNLRGELHNENARAILAQIEGILASYGKVTFESPHPNVTAPPELIALFDRLLNDPDYLQLSDAVSDLALPQKRRAALSRVRDCGRKLVTNGLVAKGWNYAGNVVKAWTGVPVPEADTLLSLISGQNFPVLVDLRPARKRAIEAWLESGRTSQPISASGDGYEGLSWILPASPPDGWDGGEISMMSFGKVSELKRELERFAQQSDAL
jgi:hypothetical protein